MSGEQLTSDIPFTVQERDVIAFMARMIIGASSEYDLPAADDPAILANILAKGRRHEKVLKEGVELLETLGRDEGKAPVTSWEPARLSDFVDSHRELSRFTRVMTVLTAQSYYEDPRVLVAIGLPAGTPFPEGHSVPQGDWSLLDPVRERPPFYRIP